MGLGGPMRLNLLNFEHVKGEIAHNSLKIWVVVLKRKIQTGGYVIVNHDIYYTGIRVGYLYLGYQGISRDIPREPEIEQTTNRYE